MDVFVQEDAVEQFLAGELKDDSSAEELALSRVNDADDTVLADRGEKAASDYKRFRRNSLVSALKKRSIRCLNKMHIMEDVREGSDVPSAQPSSPGHAEQRPAILETNDLENNHDPEEIQSAQINGTDSKSNDDLKQEEKPEGLAQTKEEIISQTEDAASNDSDNPKRKLENEEGSSKRIRTLIEQNFAIRDKILNEYTDNTSSSTLQQLQTQMDQILSEIRVLNVLALEKEKEWNNIIHLRKIKEELLLRLERRKQIAALTNDWERAGSPEPPLGEIEDHLAERKNKNPNSGLVIYSTSQASKVETGKRNSNSKNLPSAVIEINGHSGPGGDLRQQNRQRPVLDVQSIIADYRQRHPEAVPRRGRRIRSILGNQGSGSQVKQNLNASAIESNSELGLLLTAVDNGKNAAKLSEGDAASFKDVLMQFAKLSQTERQDLLQSEVKPPPYSEVTVHPVPTQPTTNSLLHGILTKSQSRSDKSTFSPTLARLLTAPERASNHNNASLCVTDMLSNNKARNEITITPVGGQFDVPVKDKGGEEEAEDSADRLVIDESEALDGRKCVDNGSDMGDDVPQCQGCNQKAAQFVCAGCGNQWYCSRECQVVAWDEHSEVCSG